MEEKCPKCGNPAVNPKPAKYSPEDKYGGYRRQAKRDGLVKEGLL
jgi:H/ACA ribonucleoprotein complex subunit 3